MSKIIQYAKRLSKIGDQFIDFSNSLKEKIDSIEDVENFFKEVDMSIIKFDKLFKELDGINPPGLIFLEHKQLIAEFNNYNNTLKSYKPAIQSTNSRQVNLIVSEINRIQESVIEISDRIVKKASVIKSLKQTQRKAK